MTAPFEYRTDERLTFEEYAEFLTRSDLGRMYPRQRFRERITALLRNADVVVTAWDDGKLIGVCFGLTDFAYFLLVTDLGVDRSYSRRGIGRRLLALAHERAGGEEHLCALTWPNERAGPFYEACGFRPLPTARAKHAQVWDLFDVRDRTES